MSDVELGMKREHGSGEYDEYGEISSYKKRSRNDGDKMRFLVQGRFCGAIIGKGGENIKRLRQQNINIKVQDTRKEGVLTLAGDRDTCVSVFKEILPLIPESPFPVNPKEVCAFEVNLLVQSDQVGCIIGKGGQRIKEIREESSGKVRVYQDCLPNSNERVVAIGGEDESRVLAAFDIILKTLDDHPLKQQVHYYDPTKNDGPQGGMGGGGPPPQHDGPGNSQMGGGLGGLGNLGGLGGLGSLAGAAGILGQLGLGGLAGAGPLGAAGALGGLGGTNMVGGGGNDNRREDRGDDRGFQRNEGGGSRGGDRDRRDSRGGDQRNGNDRGEERMEDFGDMMTETKITVGNGMCGAIIGKRGQRIREIREASGARVETSETSKDGERGPRVITITGTQRQIVIAQQMMAECVRNRTT